MSISVIRSPILNIRGERLDHLRYGGGKKGETKAKTKEAGPFASADTLSKFGHEFLAFRKPVGRSRRMRKNRMKMPDQNRSASRREFLRGSARYGWLSLVAVTTLAVRKDLGLAPGQACINRGICSGCSAFVACGLPPALAAKQTTGGN